MVQPHNSPTGNHVIQKAITILFSWAKDAQDKGEEDLCSFYLRSIEPIVREIIDSAEEMAKHAYGCRASQRMIEHCVEPLKNEILDAFVACRGALLTHTYGNYVIQKMLVHGRPSDRSDIFQSITTRVVKFSKQKQASNVVESMIRLGNAEQRQSIVRELLTCFCLDENNETESAVVSMSKDSYGNYVVKTSLELLDDCELRNQLYSELQANIAELVSDTANRHFIGL